MLLPAIYQRFVSRGRNARIPSAVSSAQAARFCDPVVCQGLEDTWCLLIKGFGSALQKGLGLKEWVFRTKGLQGGTGLRFTVGSCTVKATLVLQQGCDGLAPRLQSTSSVCSPGLSCSPDPLSRYSSPASKKPRLVWAGRLPRALLKTRGSRCPGADLGMAGCPSGFPNPAGSWGEQSQPMLLLLWPEELNSDVEIACVAVSRM